MHKPLIRYAASVTRDENTAYDVVQESFIKLWEHRKRLDPNRSLKAYLYSIVRNTAFNQLVKRTNVFAEMSTSEPNEADDDPTPDNALMTGELRNCIHKWIGELPPRRQEAFRLSRFEGLTHEEIAQMMDLEPRTVTHHIMLALKHLKDRLATYQAA